MFKRGVLVLVLAAMLAVLSSQVAAENREVSIQSSLKNPVVQSVKQHKGKISVVLKDEDTDEKEVMDIDVSELDDEDDDDDEETEEKKVAKVVKKAHRKDDDDDDDDDDDEDEEEKKVVKKAHKKAVKKAHRKVDGPDSENEDDDEDEDDDEEETKKAHKAHKKAHKAHKKQVSVEKKDNGEIVKNYPGGSVRIMGKSAPKKAHKKAHKKQTPPTEPPKSPNATTVTKDVDLEAGESVLLEFGGHVLNLTVAKNGSLIVDADNQTYVLPEVDEADVVFNGDFELDEKKNKNSTAVVPAANVTTAPSMMKMVKRDIALAAKKFSELATTVTADTVSKDAAPIVFVCGLVGALAAIIGVAAVALGRVRHDDATEDPQSVLADEAVEDVEAGIQASTEEEKKDEDAPAEKSDSLSDSDSDSEVEEGTFANDKNAASV